MLLEYNEFNERKCDANTRTDYTLLAIMFLIQCMGLWDIGAIQLQVKSKVRLKQQPSSSNSQAISKPIETNFL